MEWRINLIVRIADLEDSAIFFTTKDRKKTIRYKKKGGYENGFDEKVSVE